MDKDEKLKKAIKNFKNVSKKKQKNCIVEKSNRNLKKKHQKNCEKTIKKRKSHQISEKMLLRCKNVRKTERKVFLNFSKNVKGVLENAIKERQKIENNHLEIEIGVERLKKMVKSQQITTDFERKKF